VAQIDLRALARQRIRERQEVLEKTEIVGAVSYIRHGLLATITQLGAVHTVLVNPFWEESHDAIAVFSRRKSQKVANLLARTAATLTLVEGSKYFAMIGEATVADDPAVVAGCLTSFAAKYKRIPVQAADRVVIFVTVERTLGVPLRGA